ESNPGLGGATRKSLTARLEALSRGVFNILQHFHQRTATCTSQETTGFTTEYLIECDSVSLRTTTKYCIFSLNRVLSN
ncbi:hypothetical protein Zm00014a_028634, partial [Zea mays]